MQKAQFQKTKHLLEFRTPKFSHKSIQRRTVTSNAPAVAPNPYLLKPVYADFKQVEASRDDFDPTLPIITTKTPNPSWKYGEKSEDKIISSQQHHEIDPFEKDRPMISNYKLLVSSIPRPISFVSTISLTGIRNLAPFSYFQIVDHDPPTFVIGFSARPDRLKDTRRNLEETGECVISVVSDHMIEGMNATSLDIPYGKSEWDLSGFQAEPSSTVKPERVKESVFSVEGKLLEMKTLDFHGKGERGEATGALAIIEATRFWVRKDALNGAMDEVDLDVMRPVVQLGGIRYGRVRETFELPRPALPNELADKGKGLAKFIK